MRKEFGAGLREDIWKAGRDLEMCKVFQQRTGQKATGFCHGKRKQAGETESHIQKHTDPD